ncbi:hypothetical protein AAC387_Pa07g3296 [Persea americana]
MEGIWKLRKSNSGSFIEGNLRSGMGGNAMLGMLNWMLGMAGISVGICVVSTVPVTAVVGAGAGASDKNLVALQ